MEQTKKSPRTYIKNIRDERFRGTTLFESSQKYSDDSTHINNGFNRTAILPHAVSGDLLQGTLQNMTAAGLTPTPARL